MLKFILVVAFSLFLIHPSQARWLPTTTSPDISFFPVIHFVKPVVTLSSWYGLHDNSHSHTASGSRFNAYGYSAAHRSLPFGTKLKVTFRGRSVVVTVNDRGPAKWTGRDLDLTYGAAKAIGLVSYGVGRVTIEKI